MIWKTLKSKIIFKNNFFTLKSEDCQLPDNRIFNDYYLFDCKDWVQVIVKDDEGHFVMVEQYRHGGKKSFLEFPGGVIDENENPEDAAKREILEETGFKVSELEYLGFQYPNPALQENKIHIFYAKKSEFTDAQDLDEFEELSVKRISPSELEEQIAIGGHHSLMLSTYFTLKNYLANKKSE